MIENNKIKKLREELETSNIDCFLVPSNDEFQSEYVPEPLNRLKFVTGFSGSNGLAVIGKKFVMFFTDSRYLLQAKQELDESFEVHNIYSILDHLPKDVVIGYDPKLHSLANISSYKKYNLKACVNLVDLIWQRDIHGSELSKVFQYPVKYSGESHSKKRIKIQEYLLKKNIEALIITDPASICWLLNIRAHDVNYNPILLSYLIFHANGEIELFSNATDIDGVKCYAFKSLDERLALISNKKVQIDPNSASVYLINKITNPVFAEDPCLILKACKNAVEIKQAKRIHIIDSVAVSKLIYWLENSKQKLYELDVVQKIYELRSLHPDFIYPSFSTIAAFAEHGAIIHYSPNQKTNKEVSGNGLFLLDSGGHYFGGTTDITRVIPVGKINYQQKLDFTLVLKGHIALASAVFPKGTTGEQLDVLARYNLWQYGKDYGHGTGHGVGNCLSVHEGPQRIGKNSKVALMPGMIISNEPGYYKDGEYGIRIENLMLIKELKNGYLCMEILSLVPIDKRLILTKILSAVEIKWINDYHQKIYVKLSPYLTNNEKAWLKKKTLPLVVDYE